MPVACPKCGSRFLRDSRPRTKKEKRDKWFLKEPLRCMDCQHRFVDRTFKVKDIFYARCPKCRRMDLNGWTGKTYQPPFFVGIKVALGAKRWRCEYCRINFASFRDRLEKFTFKRWQNLQAAMHMTQERDQFLKRDEQ